MPGLDQRLRQARELSWDHHGRRITFYLPGMFVYFGRTGKYPALSITGSRCGLSCAHCGGQLLPAMKAAATPAALTAACRRIWANGHHGVLISGGCDRDGRLPWQPFLSAIAEVKARTGLFVSVHSGLVDAPTAQALKTAGVDQALIDAVGDDETFRSVTRLAFGVERIEASLDALVHAGLPVVPHIVCGLDYGRIRGESSALEMVSRYRVSHLVVVSLMPLKGTPMENVRPPAAEAVAEVIAEARRRMPRALISLGCARRRGGGRIERLALDAGVNRMALPAEETVAYAQAMGLAVKFQKTCCSVSLDVAEASW